DPDLAPVFSDVIDARPGPSPRREEVEAPAHDPRLPGFAHGPNAKLVRMDEPGYLALLETGELEERVEKLYALLKACTVCPRDCGNDRLAGVLASCASGENPVVSAYTPHFGEEPFLSGAKGAGNVFFGNCNLRCVYCQNFQISQDYRTQRANEVSVERL